MTQKLLLFLPVVLLIAYQIYDWYQDKMREKNKFEELKKWHEMRDKGIITEEEFNEKKAEILE